MNIVALAGIVVGFGLCVVLPIVAVLAEHQRKMARILHGRPENAGEGFGEIVAPVKAMPSFMSCRLCGPR